MFFVQLGALAALAYVAYAYDRYLERRKNEFLKFYKKNIWKNLDKACYRNVASLIFFQDMLLQNITAAEWVDDDYGWEYGYKFDNNILRHQPYNMSYQVILYQILSKAYRHLISILVCSHFYQIEVDLLNTR